MGHFGRAVGVCLIVILAGCASVGTPEPPAGTDTGYEDFVDWADTYLRRETTNGRPGVSAVFFEHDRTILSGGYGLRDRRNAVPVTPLTVFQVGSISKAVTALAVLDAAERGLISLDDPVERHLDSFSLPASAYSSEEVTIRRVLSHTAGLSVSGYPGLPPDEPVPSTVESLRGRTGRFFLVPVGPVELDRPPGTDFDYSGGGFTLLQLMIEDLSRRDFASYMDSEVLGVLGMRSSTFDSRAVDRGALATPYSSFGRGLPAYRFAAKAAAGLYATADDLALVLKDMIRGYLGSPRQFLRPESYAEMLAPVGPAGGPDTSVGLGLFMVSLDDGTVFAYHSGGNRGWRCVFGVNLHTGEGMVLLTNSGEGMRRVVDPILAAYRQYRR